MRARTILTNTGYNLAAVVLSSLVGVALTPYLLARLGHDLFGVWALFGVVIVASQMSDFGLSRALVRNLARYRATGRWSLIARDLNSIFWPLFGSSLALTLLGWLLAPDLARWLGVPEVYGATAVVALRVLVLSLAPVSAGLLLGATLEGAQRMGYTSAAHMLNRLLFASGAILSIGMGWGIVGVAGAHLVAVSVQTVALALAAARTSPGLRMAPRLFHPSTLFSDTRFGSRIFATGLVALGYTATNKIVLARWVSLESVAYYELATIVASQLFVLALSMSQALYPALAAAEAERGLSDVQYLFTRSLRLLVLAMVPLAAGVIALAFPFVRAWLGEAVTMPAAGMQYLAAAWLVVALATAASVGFQALGLPGWTTFFSAYNAGLNLILALVLVPLFGFWGVIVANVVAVSSSGLFTILFFSRLVRLSLRQLIHALSPDVLAWTAVTALGLAWVGALVPAPGLLVVMSLAGVYLLLYTAGVFGLGLLRPEENMRLRSWLGRHFPFPEPSS